MENIGLAQISFDMIYISQGGLMLAACSVNSGRYIFKSTF